MHRTEYFQHFIMHFRYKNTWFRNERTNGSFHRIGYNQHSDGFHPEWQTDQGSTDRTSEIGFILSKEASQGVFEDWEYKLISLFEPKPLDLAFKYFLIQEAGSATATQFYDQLKMTNKWTDSLKITLLLRHNNVITDYVITSNVTMTHQEVTWKP